MAPGVAFLYSGLLRRKNALSMLLLGLAVYSVATIQWFFWGEPVRFLRGRTHSHVSSLSPGYSLAFSSSGPFIGDLTKFGLIGVLDAPSVGSTKIPELRTSFFPLVPQPILTLLFAVYAFYQVSTLKAS